MQRFEWNADEYARHSTAQEIWAKELLQKLKLKTHENVLDLGCGDGKITAEIANLIIDGSAVGVDSSESMINLARAKYPPKKYKNLSFMIMDAKRLMFDEKFDVVFSNAVLHWVDDHSEVLEGINRSLKPGGRFLIQTGGTGNAAAAFETVKKMASLDDWLPYLKDAESPYNFLSDKDYERLIPEKGFKPLRIELLKKDMIHDGIEGLKGFIRTTWLPFTTRIPEEKREQFIAETADHFISQYPMDNEGKVHIGMVRLEAEAVKI
jgi:trans-aconitate 2-methyltransferase